MKRAASKALPNNHSQSETFVPYSSAGTRLLWSVPAPISYRVVAGSVYEPQYFQQIMKVRAETDSRWPDQSAPCDEYSDHYCLFAEDLPIGCISMTRAIHGKIFLQDYFPEVFFDHFGDRIMSSYRFRLHPKFRRTSEVSGGLSLATLMGKEAWREQIQKGVGLDLINVEKKYIRYYQRLGYILFEGHEFLCPVFQEPISVMYLPSDPTRESVISDLLKERDDYLFLSDIQRVLRRTTIGLRSVG